MTQDEQKSDDLAYSPEEPPREEIMDLTKERDEYRSIAQRTQADFANFKRRVEDEKMALHQNASTNVLRRLLPVVDDLQRAIDSLPETDVSTPWTEGIRMILRKLNSLIESEGVTSFSPEIGDSFDPTLHEAVYYQPSDEQNAGTILTTFQPGYRNASGMLRPAQVIVAKAPEPTNESNNNTERTDP
jgi:molecular chaperone GrpE